MKKRPGQAGVSLVELMIAVTLGLLITSGVISIFVGNKRGFRAQDSANQIQENARFGVAYLARLIRSADLWGGIKPASITTGILSISGPRSSKICNADWIAKVEEGLHGYQGSEQPLIDCVAKADYLPQSDMIVVRRIDPDTFTTPEDVEAKENSRRNYLRVRVGLDGHLYQGNQIPEANQNIPPGDGVLNYEYDFQLLFLRPCNIKRGGSCTAVDSKPTLVSLQLQSDGGLSQVALVENVEQMKFEYGVDSNQDQRVDQYQNASAVADWSKVLSVRIHIIVRGDAPDHFKDHRIYPMGTGFCHGPANSSCQSKYTGFEGHQRKLFAQDILIRNRVLG